MPLVVLKARSRLLRGRPAWQKDVPKEPELREAYRIAADNEEKFARAFMQVQRSMLDDETKKVIRRAWRDGGSLVSILNLLPTFSGGADDPKIYRRLTDQLHAAYLDVVSASGKAATQRLNEAFKTNLRFEVMNEEEVQKARKRRIPRKMPIVPINPYSIKWMQERALRLVTQGVVATQMDVVRQIMTDGFERGLRAEAVMGDIEANIGLTTREFNAVARRRLLHQEAGMAAGRVRELTDAYSAKLLRSRAKRIARTETIEAQAAGRNAAWRLARDSGQLPEVERVWAARGASSDPNAPCEICEELDGKTAQLDQPYDSVFLGGVMHPPAHPNCACTETLRKVK